MPHPAMEKPQNQLLSWIVLIVGGLFLIPTLPFTLLLISMPIWKPDETSFLSLLFTALPVAICAATIWAMRQAYKAIRLSASTTGQASAVLPKSPEQVIENDLPSARKKPVWPWAVIVPGVLLLFALGPGAMMLPIMPVYLAAMSTDSGTAPDYVPALIVVIGYTLILAYAVLLVKAIQVLRAK
ncbi:hypothetical protein [Planococcus shixiaomingii]|uniref:hypothetical protein n=1 Tax=Planococcus shixiaomingii TaxID=3058393 RepID=UPI002608A5A4|nr:hypothetical protein [Planococcus sp. N022]WKA55712.1 hypothetical protein QWY21_04800 [Planococcus sp. N022]